MMQRGIGHRIEVMSIILLALGLMILQTYDSPYVNRYDSRMTPNTFEGYTFRGAFGDDKANPGVQYVAGYVPKIKLRDSDEFVYMSEAAGATAISSMRMPSMYGK